MSTRLSTNSLILLGGLVMGWLGTQFWVLPAISRVSELTMSIEQLEDESHHIQAVLDSTLSMEAVLSALSERWDLNVLSDPATLASSNSDVKDAINVRPTKSTTDRSLSPKRVTLEIQLRTSNLSESDFTCITQITNRAAVSVRRLRLYQQRLLLEIEDPS